MWKDCDGVNTHDFGESRLFCLANLFALKKFQIKSLTQFEKKE